MIPKWPQFRLVKYNNLPIYIYIIYMELCLASLECNVYMWYVAGFGIGQAVPEFLFKSMPSATTYLHLCLIFLSIREQKTPGTFHCGRVQKDPPGYRKHHWTQKKNTILVAFKAIREQKHLGLWDFGVPRNTDGNVPKTPFQGTKSERSPYDP